MSVKYSAISIPALKLRRGLAFLTEAIFMERRYKDPLKKIEGRITGDPDKALPIALSEGWRVGWLLDNKKGVPWFYLQLKKDRAILLYPTYHLDDVRAMFSLEEVKEYFECVFSDEPDIEHTMSDLVPF